MSKVLFSCTGRDNKIRKGFERILQDNQISQFLSIWLAKFQNVQFFLFIQYCGFINIDMYMIMAVHQKHIEIFLHTRGLSCSFLDSIVIVNYSTHTDQVTL